MTPGFPSEDDPLAIIRGTPAWKPYAREVKTLLDYWTNTEYMKIRVEKADDFLQPFTIEFEYSHRWRDTYRAMLLAKFYQLEAALQKSGAVARPVTMMTLTTYQDGPASVKEVGGYTIGKAFDVLAVRRRNLINNIRRHIAPGIPYFWITEPHKSGYPHTHVALFDALTDDQMERAQSLWTDKYGAGGKDAHRLPWERLGTREGMFSIKQSAEPLKSVRNYLMKYMTKNFSPSSMTPAELVYHAVAKASRFRFYGASRDITHMMQRARLPDTTKWLKTEVISEWGDVVATRKLDAYEEVTAIGRDRLENLGFGVVAQ